MAVSLWLLVSFLVVLLALPVAIVIAAWARRTSRAEFPRSSPPRTDNSPTEGADAEPDLPEPATGPPAPPLPRRVAGQSGVAYPAGDPAHPPGVSQPPQVSASPPWGPAPKPPGVPERIKRLGWDKAAGERRSQGPGRTLTLAALPRHPRLPLSGSCRGLRQTDGYPSARHRTARCPGPLSRSARAGAQSHGENPTRTRPGPHSWPREHRSGYRHQDGRLTCSMQESRTRERTAGLGQGAGNRRYRGRGAGSDGQSCLGRRAGRRPAH